MTERSPKLRDGRPFKIVHECWFGGTPLNGMVWRIQTRDRSGLHYTHSVRDGGPFGEHTSLSEALAWVRDYRRQRKVAAWALQRMREDPTFLA